MTRILDEVEVNSYSRPMLSVGAIREREGSFTRTLQIWAHRLHSEGEKLADIRRRLSEEHGVTITRQRLHQAVQQIEKFEEELTPAVRAQLDKGLRYSALRVAQATEIPLPLVRYHRACQRAENGPS